MRILLLICVCLSMNGCAAVATGLVSVGAGFGIGHHISGTSYRTITEPLPRVGNAIRTALKRMAINVESTQKTKSGELLKASVEFMGGKYSQVVAPSASYPTGKAIEGTLVIK